MLTGMQKHTLAGAAIIIVAVITTGCDKVPLLAPTSSTVTLTAPTRTLPLGGTTEVTATVLESGGTPVQNGTTVRFTTTLGSVSPVEAQTRNGNVTVTFSAGTASGTAEIRATSGAAGASSSSSTTTTTTTTATNVISITIGSANASRVTASANPAVVPSTGGSSQITATVFDAAGNPLPNITVFFSTDAGSVSSASATTDGAGRAATTLTTTRKANVTATVGGSGGTGGTTTDQRSTTVVVDVNVLSVTLKCQAGTTGTAAAGCTQAVGSPVIFTIDRTTTGTTNSAIASATLDFGDGTSTNIGPIPGASTTVTHTYQSTGTFTATLRATDVTGETITLTNTVIINRTPLNVTLSASSTSVAGVGATTTFTATVTPTGEANAIESYTWDFGDGTTITTSGNVTTHVYTSNGVKKASVTVKAVDGRTASASVEFIVSGI